MLPVLAAVVVARVSGAAAPMDPRDMSAGSLIHTWDYSDQPYCVVVTQKHLLPLSAQSLFVCSVTVNDGAREGKSGEHIVSVTSSDQGRTWSEPVALEPTSVARGIDNAYSTIVLVPSGRIYCIYNMNLDNIHTLNGKNISRVDEIGHFVMRYSDTAGKSWSKERYEVPYRLTEVDLANSFGGKTKIMWSVDQTKVRNGTAYFAFTKIGSYTQNPPQEGWILASSNILTETDASRISWSLLPEGDHGAAPIGQACAFPSNDSSCVAEEWHIIPLAQTPGFYAVFRTSQGVLGSSRTADSTARTGWVPSSAAQFWPSPTSAGRAGGGALKNPRGPITLKRFRNGLYLLLWYFNGETGFGNGKDRENLNNRMPYWISSGRETAEGDILFSAPEIVLYNRSAIYNTAKGVARPGYPDFIEDIDGSVFITETNKQSALCHRVDPALLQLLWGQETRRTVAAGPVHQIGAGATTQPLPPHTLPTLSKPWAPGAGLTIELWLTAHAKAETATNLVQAGRVTLNVTRDAWPGRQMHAHGLTLTLRDGNQVRVVGRRLCAVCASVPCRCYRLVSDLGCGMRAAGGVCGAGSNVRPGIGGGREAPAGGRVGRWAPAGDVAC